MYKYYICIIMQKNQLEEMLNAQLDFTNGEVKDPEIYKNLEDKFQQPIIFLRQSTYDPNEILIMAADGMVQTNPITQKRTVIINGGLEDLKVILTDLIRSRDHKNAEDIFKSYYYGCSMPEQLSLKDWFYETYQ